MPEKSRKSKTKKIRTKIKVNKNNFNHNNAQVKSCPIKEEQENHKKEKSYSKRKKFPLNIKAWDGSLSDCSSVPTFKNETNNSANEKNGTENEQAKEGKEGGATVGKTYYIKCLEAKNTNLQVKDIENRDLYRLGKSALHAWSSITDVDTLTKPNECQVDDAISASKISVNDRVSQKLGEQKLISMSVANNKDLNNNSHFSKPPNTQDEITVADTESGFPTYFSDGADSEESIDSATSSVSIPIPAFGESTFMESNTVKEKTTCTELEEKHPEGFMRMLTWCCLPLRSFSDTPTWSCRRNKFTKSCEGDHETKACQ